MKILVCGNGPSLLSQLKNRSLDKFDKVVRVNCWDPIPGYDNRCDAWVFYPLHHIGMAEEAYDLTEYAWIKEQWIAHPFTISTARKIFNREPDYVLRDSQVIEFRRESGLRLPRTGLLALYMAMRISCDVWAAGFDCYSTNNPYYFKKKPGQKDNLKSPHDNPLKDKQWIDSQVTIGKLKILEEKHD